MVILASVRRKVPVPALARWLLGLGIAATLAANVAHGLGRGRLVPWWPRGRCFFGAYDAAELPDPS
jgi:hypothetical protein